MHMRLTARRLVARGVLKSGVGTGPARQIVGRPAGGQHYRATARVSRISVGPPRSSRADPLLAAAAASTLFRFGPARGRIAPYPQQGQRMKQLQKVIWTKGVLLTPQHLQTQDRFLEDLLAFRLGAHAFCPWGFTRLEIDREALAGGSLALSAAAGLFPDGVPFDIPGADAAPAPKALEPHWDPDRGR